LLESALNRLICNDIAMLEDRLVISVTKFSKMENILLSEYHSKEANYTVNDRI
jgi:hypothetical protein